MTKFVRCILEALGGPTYTPPAPTDPNRWSDHDLLDYCAKRYAEIDGLVTKTRSAGSSLLVWQTAFLVGTLGLEAKTGLLGYEPLDSTLHPLTALSVFFLAASVVVSARVSFWAEEVSIPVAPRALLEDHERDRIDGRAVIRSFVRVYESTKTLLATLQSRLRRSIIFSGLGLLFFTALFIVISTQHKTLFQRAFSRGK